MLEVMAYYLAIALVMNFFVFLIAFNLRSDSFTDLIYTLTFVVLGFVALASSRFDPVKLFFFMFIFLWALRLGVFLFNRVRYFGHDNRFDGMRNNFVKFLGFFLLQGLTATIVMIPAILFLTGDHVFFNWISLLGSVVWLKGFLFEAVADDQKLKFIKNKRNKGKFITNGLWKLSRHPNYYGEILMWFGVYLFALSSLVEAGGYQWLVGLIGPVFITLMLLFVSGIPILEKRMKKKFGMKREYKRYVERTPLLIPNYFIK